MTFKYIYKIKRNLYYYPMWTLNQPNNTFKKTIFKKVFESFKKFLLVFRNKILFKNLVWSHKKPSIYWIIFLKTDFKKVFGSFEKYLKKFKIFFIFSIITQKNS